MEEEPLIQDIPSIQKTLKDIRSFRAFERAFPLIKPFLRLLGVDVDKISDAFSKLDNLEREAEKLAQIPDRFNELFATRGWIIYDVMNLEVAKAAIAKAESGDIEGAEAYLVSYYSTDAVRMKLRFMHAVNAFRPRMQLAKKALIDYQEERYHACIPVVLALLDGLVNELHEKQRGFFAEDVDLTAWDSIAAHSRGLSILTNIFRKGRRKTTTEQITIPYRHGIMHGMDLGYDNKIVAAKTWAALFSTRDWALKAEMGLLRPPPPEAEVTWKEIIQQLRENEADKQLLEAWKARVLRIGTDIPPSWHSRPVPPRHA